MRVDQHDIAQLDDNTIKRLVIEAQTGDHGRLSPLWHALGDALIEARRERHRRLAVMETDLDDSEGELIPGLDPPS